MAGEADRPGLELRIQREGTKVVVRTLGSLVGERWTGRFREFLHEHYLDDGVVEIVVDLADVRQVDLEGISTLLTLSAESIRHGKRFAVRGLGGVVRERLERTGALRYLPDEEARS